MPDQLPDCSRILDASASKRFRVAIAFASGVVRVSGVVSRLTCPRGSAYTRPLNANEGA